VARLVRLAGVLAILTISSALLASCGTGGATSDVRHSCVYVKRALAIESQSEQPGLSSSRRHELESNALSELLKATPSAAAATSIDGSWNPLMTTINEAERVPIPDLEASLTRLCRVADSQTPYL
jgi:predicted small secreted protein